MPNLVTAVQLLPFMGNKESHDTNHGCPGLHLEEAVVTAETVSNMGTQTCNHIDCEDIIQILIPKASLRWRPTPKWWESWSWKMEVHLGVWRLYITIWDSRKSRNLDGGHSGLLSRSREFPGTLLSNLELSSTKTQKPIRHSIPANRFFCFGSGPF